jgi:hypothetical protein
MNITLSQLLKKPSALFPLAMSMAAFGMVLVHTFMFGVTREADEGTAAHVFQLLMIAQAPFALAFAITWIPKATKNTIYILTMQIAAALVAVFAVVFLT